MRRPDYFSFGGGLNLTSPALSMKPGELFDCKNYEAATNGGYSRIKGYEPFDGQTAPSSLVRGHYPTRALWVAAIDTAIAHIGTVPGEGDVLGVWYYNDIAYAFRNKTGGLTAGMYKSTASGWVEVATGVTLNPDGRYEFVNYNFGGHAGSKKMYGCDGVNNAFEFDGTTFTQVTTGMTTDTPEHIYAHKKQLFLMFTGGSVQHSPIGNPTGVWSAVTGAAEIGLGDTGTGFASTPGDALAMFGRNSVNMLYGDSSGNWTMKPFTSNAGAVEWSVQRLSYPIFLDDYGVTQLQTAETYGDFRTTALTGKVKTLIDSRRGMVVASVVVRDKDQYRLYFNDKTVLTLSFNKGQMIGATTQTLDHQVTSVCSSEDSTGAEKLFFGSDDGYIYQLESGNSFAGNTIQSFIIPAFNNFRSPQHMKRFFKVVLELDIDAETLLTFLPLYDYGSSYVPTPYTEMATVSDGGSVWGDGVWSEFIWGGQYVGEAYGYLDGVGRNISLNISSSTNHEPPHLLQGVLFHYAQRGLRR